MCDSSNEAPIDDIKRLKNSIIRINDLVSFYREHPTTTLDIMDSTTTVTMRDLGILIEALLTEQESWVRGYDRGYAAGRDGEIAWRKMQEDD